MPQQEADRPRTGTLPLRPLTGEPLCLDLLNTRWHDRHGHHDLLTDREGLAVWLAGSRAAAALRDGDLRADHATLGVARQTRAVLAEVVGGRPGAAGLAAFNRISGSGRIRRLLTPDGPAERVDVERPEHRLGWLAATDYLRLLDEAPERIRTCATPGCGLFFHDVSRNGTRKWCSRSGCGNRARAARYHASRAARLTGA
ncbi:CGNR zinc finger domain-containing protein [Streptomyces sp. NPDC035033]|uniref:CGNR zinc finger domain-containing protein n=1 Tax=Streptomyces sp. NPDC035033 TaxID=3155368 RepID=UPI0033F7F9AD